MHELAAAVETLHDPKLRTVSNAMLGDAITDWTSDTGLQRHLVPTRTPTTRHAGLELGM